MKSVNDEIPSASEADPAAVFLTGRIAGSHLPGAPIPGVLRNGDEEDDDLTDDSDCTCQPTDGCPS